MQTNETKQPGQAAVPPAKPKNPHRITVKKVFEMQGWDPTLQDPETNRSLMDSVVPACCDEGCEVEPDGRCEHGCPSVLLAMGVI